MLLAALAAGDAGAFVALYDDTCARLYGVALRVLRDPTLAQEATRDAYLQIWATAKSFDPADVSAEAWLTTLIHRVAVDRLRVDRVGGSHGAKDEVRQHLASAPTDVVDDWECEAIALAYYGALTYQEVAEFLGVPLPIVVSHIRADVSRLAQSPGRD